jgi:hypothetical protein
MSQPPTPRWEQDQEDKICLGHSAPENNPIKSSFDNIVEFVKDALHKIVSADEYKVTARLAGPFKRGGLLVLLQEPLLNHPWPSGVDAVVFGCETWKILREGISVASNGILSLVDDVSVIDRWAFLHRTLHTELQKKTPEEMRRFDRLVLQFICTKKPDAILCLGRVRTECFGLRIALLIIQEGSEAVPRAMLSTTTDDPEWS